MCIINTYLLNKQSVYHNFKYSACNMLMINIKNCTYMLYVKRSDIYFIDFSYKILRLFILRDRKIIKFGEIIACFLQKFFFIYI